MCVGVCACVCVCAVCVRMHLSHSWLNPSIVTSVANASIMATNSKLDKIVEIVTTAQATT